MEFKLVRMAWDTSAAADLEPAMKHDSLAGVDYLQCGVEQGAMVLLGCYRGAQRIGSVVLRFEEGEGVREMVIVAAGGKCQGVLLGPLVLPQLVDVARALDADQVRLHTARPGMMALAERAGFFEAERVYRKVLH